MNFISISYKHTNRDFKFTKPMTYTINGETRLASDWIEILRNLYAHLGVEFEEKPRSTRVVIDEIENLLKQHSTNTKIILLSHDWLN